MTNMRILRDNLYAGYVETGSVNAEMSETGLDGNDRVKQQGVQLRTDLRPLIESARLVRLYSSELKSDTELCQLEDLGKLMQVRHHAFDLRFADSEYLVEFLVDSGRVVSRLRGDKSILPAYDNLLLFFPSWEVVPLEWWANAASVLYSATPFKGMNRIAKSELKNYLEENRSGCVLSVCLTRFRSAVYIFPAEFAMAPFGERLMGKRFP